MSLALIRLALFFSPVSGAALAGKARPSGNCAPADGLSFICGTIKPEDMQHRKQCLQTAVYSACALGAFVARQVKVA